MSKGIQAVAETVETEDERIQRIRALIDAAVMEGANVRALCKEHGLSPAQYYRLRGRYEEQGEEGLRRVPHRDRANPNRTSPQTLDAVLECSRSHPEWGSKCIADQLKLDVHRNTVQRILKRNGRGQKADRALVTRRELEAKGFKTTPRRWKGFQRVDPVQHDWEDPCVRVGQLLFQKFSCVGSDEGLGEVYVHLVVDAYSRYGFASVHATENGAAPLPHNAAAVLTNHVFPRYEEWGLEIERIATAGGAQFWQKNVQRIRYRGRYEKVDLLAKMQGGRLDGRLLPHAVKAYQKYIEYSEKKLVERRRRRGDPRPVHPFPWSQLQRLFNQQKNSYRVALETRGIGHERLDRLRYKLGAYIKTFQRLIMTRFFKPRGKFQSPDELLAEYEVVLKVGRGMELTAKERDVMRAALWKQATAKLQADLDEWLRWYNCKRTIRAYPHRGRTPEAVVKEYLASRKKD